MPLNANNLMEGNGTFLTHFQRNLFKYAISIAKDCKFKAFSKIAYKTECNYLAQK